MDTIFTWLSDAMTGAPWLAVVAAAGWGVASLVLSPCHLASIPLIVGFIAERKGTTPRQVLGYALLFALGILLSIAAVGGLTAAAGRPFAPYGALPERRPVSHPHRPLRYADPGAHARGRRRRAE